MFPLLRALVVRHPSRSSYSHKVENAGSSLTVVVYQLRFAHTLLGRKAGHVWSRVRAAIKGLTGWFRIVYMPAVWRRVPCVCLSARLLSPQKRTLATSKLVRFMSSASTPSISSLPALYERTPVSMDVNRPFIRTAACLIIGDEVLNGKTHDSNSNKMAKMCFELGIELKRVEVIPDVVEDIMEAVQRMVRIWSYLTLVSYI